MISFLLCLPPIQGGITSLYPNYFVCKVNKFVKLKIWESLYFLPF